MTAPDLTPAEARAEVEAFLGEGWTCAAWNQVGEEGATCAVNARRQAGMRVWGTGPTYRAAVEALKQAWRDAVRPWVEAASNAYNNADMHEEVVARVLKEDAK